MSAKINMLTKVQTGEVSLVRRGANNKRIALTKAQEIEEMDLMELIKNVLATEAEGETALIKSLTEAKTNEESIEIAKAIYRLQHGFKDKLSAESLTQVVKAAGYDLGEEKPKPETKKPEMAPEVAAIFKAQQDELASVKKALEDERKERMHKEFVQKCAETYAYVPGMSSEELGTMLQKAYEVSDDFGKKLEQQWAATSEAVKKGALINAQGNLATSKTSGAPLDKLTKLAQDIQEKEKVSFAKAFDKAMRTNVELYQEYLMENPAQTGRKA